MGHILSFDLLAMLLQTVLLAIQLCTSVHYLFNCPGPLASIIISSVHRLKIKSPSSLFNCYPIYLQHPLPCSTLAQALHWQPWPYCWNTHNAMVACHLDKAVI